MRKWIDQSTFDELLLANAEDNIERAIRSASAVLETVQEFVPEAALFYRVTPVSYTHLTLPTNREV